MTTMEENKALVRRFYDEVVNKGNLGFIDQVTATNYVDHTAPPGVPSGLAGEKAWFAMLHAAFPDGKTTVEDIVAEGDKVVVRGKMVGTQKGEFMGIPATGKRVEIHGIDISRFQNGKSVEHWGQWDTTGMMVQLGVIPPPGQPPQRK